MDKECLTPKEFAEVAGVSVQTIYKQMSGRLAPYVQVINGHKRIAAIALKEYYGVEQLSQPDSTDKVEKTTENQPDSTEKVEKTTQDNQSKTTEQRIDELERLLKDQIEEDRKEKEFLKEQIRQKDKTIESLTENLKVAQQLAAADKKKLLELEQKQQEREQDIVEQSVVPSADRKQGQGDRQKGLKGLIRRLFG